MTALSTYHHNEFSGLRRFDVKRDVDGVARLVDIAFAEEMARVGGTGQDSIRSLSRYVPLVWATSLFSSQYLDIFAGFVWEADGRVVGNVSVSRMLSDGRRWMIGNMAVHPDYQHHGIAKRLLWAAVELVREKHGEWALLDVRHDNTAAYELYRGMGFRKIDSYAEYRLDRVPPIKLDLGVDRGIRPRRNADAVALYRLARLATPGQVLEVLPVHEEDFRSSPLAGFSGGVRSLLGLSITRRFVMEVDNRLAAALETSLQQGRPPHRFSLTVDPEHAGAVEDDLVRFALERFARRRNKMVIAEVAPVSGAATVLGRWGFEEARILDRLALRIGNP